MPVINLVATVAIAILAYHNYKLSKNIKSGSDGYQEDMKNIMEAVVISNIVANGISGDISARIQELKSHYKDRKKYFVEKGEM